jgi:hypothetical protein
MSLQRAKLNEVIKEIKQCNLKFGEDLQQMAKVIKDSSHEVPDLFIAEYSYGESIINSDGFIAPKNSNPLIEKELLSKSGKKRIPLALILQNSSEIYIEIKPGNTKSLKLLSVGEFIGTYEAVDLMQHKSSEFKSIAFTPSWQAIAGSRSVFLLNRFRSRESQDKIISVLDQEGFFTSYTSEKYNFFNDNNFRDELKKNTFPVFKFIADLNSTWKTRVVIFSDEWFSDDFGCFNPFCKYIYDSAWNQASFSINLDAISSQLSSIVGFSSMTDNQILLDLTQICSSETFAHEVFQPSDQQITGPFSIIQDFLQKGLGYDKPPLIIHPVDINAKMQVAEKVIGYYSTTFSGQLFSDKSNETIDLTKTFFKPMDRILIHPKLLEYLSEICGYRVVLSPYGRKRNEKVTDKLKLNSLDNRSIFDDLTELELEQNVDYDHPYLRACIKAEFTKQN